jgi:hypothetical protein
MARCEALGTLWKIRSCVLGGQSWMLWITPDWDRFLSLLRHDAPMRSSARVEHGPSQVSVLDGHDGAITSLQHIFSFRARLDQEREIG